MKINIDTFLKNWQDDFWSEDNESNFIKSYEMYCTGYPLLKKANQTDYIREVRAIHLELYTIAWQRSVKKKYQYDLLVYITKDSALKQLNEISAAYNNSIPGSASNGGESIRTFSEIMLNALLPETDYNTPAFDELVDVFFGEYSVLYHEMCRHLKTVKLTKK